jgi:glucose-6-phosphate isomerase
MFCEIAEGTPDWLAPHRFFEGNRPSNTILADRLTPGVLGMFVVLFEDSVFTQGVIWQIDSSRSVGSGTRQGIGPTHYPRTREQARADAQP